MGYPSARLLLLTTIIVLSLSATALGQPGANIRLNTDHTDRPQDEVQVRVSPTRPDVVVAVWREYSTGTAETAVGVSHDAGVTWQHIILPDLPYLYNSDPTIEVDAEGRFYILIMNWNGDYSDSQLALFKSLDDGLTWDGPVTVVSTGPGNYELKGWLAIDRTGGPDHGNIYVGYLKAFSYTPYNQVMFCRSVDGGQTFSTPQPISGIYQLYWPIPAVTADGTVLITWPEVSGESYYRPIQCRRSFDGGESFDSIFRLDSTSFTNLIAWPSNLIVHPYTSIDADLSGGPFQGNLYHVRSDWWDVSQTDIYFSKSTDDGLTWSSLMRINDDTLKNQADQFEPWMDVNPNGVLVACWLDWRLDPVDTVWNCFMTASFDGGDSWTRNERVSTESSSYFYAKSAAPPDKIGDTTRSTYIGDCIGISASSNFAFPVWTDTRNGNQDIYAAAVPIGYHAPQPVYPNDGELVAFNFNPTHFQWTPVVSDTTPIHRLQISTDSTFATIDVLDTAGIDHNYMLFSAAPILPKDVYYWRLFDSLPDGSIVGPSAVYSFEILFCPEIEPLFGANNHLYDGEPVQFTNLSSNFDSCIWDLGDGTITRETDPWHTYSGPGSYTIKLVDYFECGFEQSADSLIRTDWMVVSCCALVGDVDHSGSGPDISDLVYLVSYMFQGGPEPPCLLEADMNVSNTAPDISDLIYLVTYMFQGGPVPVPCH